ncbi:MAG: protein tyrosine phosphatase [Actinobacteria bacterium]|nr:protein tyrosine phosphatase [Actinomycetota bacterium]
MEALLIHLVKILILCTGNSCRSQMAEGIVRHLYSDRCEVFSAGSHPSSVNESAISVMNEIGIDISGHQSQALSLFEGQSFDWVITVCDHAKDACPVFLGQYQHLHWSFEDPVGLSLDVFRQVRDLIYHKFESELGRYLS